MKFGTIKALISVYSPDPGKLAVGDDCRVIASA